MTGEEIKRSLVEFARKWSLYDGSERAEAQTFLNELFAAYGLNRYEAGARFEEPQAGRFLDLIWPRVCIFEMKRPSEAGRLASHREQAFGYWRNAADPEHNVPAPHFVVLCAFRRFEIWEPAIIPMRLAPSLISSSYPRTSMRSCSSPVASPCSLARKQPLRRMLFASLPISSQLLESAAPRQQMSSVTLRSSAFGACLQRISDSSSPTSSHT